MNELSPLDEKQINYLHRCGESWFNVAEGGKRRRQERAKRTGFLFMPRKS